MLATNGPQDSGPVLRGRASECARLDELLSAVRRGESGAFVVRGEAGMGKTALLKYLAGQSGECLIVRAVGVEAEMELPFAILHQLCLPVLDRAEQRRAMSTTISKFDLWSHDVARLSEAILARLRDGWMPCDGAWADERIALFQDWIAAGKPA